MDREALIKLAKPNRETEFKAHTAGEFGITGRNIIDESKAVILKDRIVAVDTPTGWSFFTQEGKRIPLGLGKISQEQIDEATDIFTHLEGAISEVGATQREICEPRI